MASTSGRMNAIQKGTLVSFMEEHPELVRGKFSNSFTKLTANRLWQELSDILNSLGGANKTVKLWKKTWSDIMVESKRRLSAAGKSISKTGGGPPSDDGSLSPLHNRILTIIGPAVIDGISDAVEVGLLNTSYEDGESDKTDEGEPHVMSQGKRQFSTDSAQSNPKKMKTKREQADQWLEIESKKVKALANIAEALQNIANSISRVSEVLSYGTTYE